MGHRVIAAASAAVMALAGVQTAGVLAAGGASGDATNPCARWVGPGTVDVSGRPTGFRPTDPAGIYIWHDCFGWHLRSLDLDPTQDHGTAGTVTVDDGTFPTVAGFALTGKDTFSTTGNVLAFHFRNDAGKDGLDFRVSGESITFHIVQSPGGRSAVFLGSARQRPPTIRRFTVHFTGLTGTEDPEAAPVTGDVVVHHPVSAVRRPGLSATGRRGPGPAR